VRGRPARGRHPALRHPRDPSAESFEVGFHGDYRTIDAPHRIVSTEVYEGFTDPDAEGDEAGALNTITFDERDAVTTMTFSSRTPSRSTATPTSRPAWRAAGRCR